MSLIAQKLISASGPKEATDGDFNLVTQLYQFDGTNGAQNNTLLDSSPESHTVTRNADIVQGTFSPFSSDEGKWSVSFDGTDDYLQIANSSDFNLGSGDFTLEAYVFQTSDASTASNSHNIFNKWNNTSSAKSYAFRITSSSGQKLQFFWSTDGNNNNYITSNDSLTSNQWHHVAVVNNGGTITLYIDGTAQSSTGTAGTLYSASVNLNIGRTDADSGSQYFDGFISNARLVKGTAVYTSNFTPSTSPLTAITNTKLLTCCSNRFRDKSTSAHTITPSSAPKIQPFSPFAPSSAYNAATKGGSALWPTETDKTNKITLSSSADFAFGTGAFTIDCWVYVTADTTPYSRVWHVGPFWNNNNAIGLVVNDTAESDKTTFDVYVAGGRTCVSTNVTPRNEWFHVACVRDSSGNFKLFINGNLDATNTSYTSTDISSGGNQTFAIGNIVETSSGIEAEAQFEGYISNLRVVKGTAIYSSSFTPPTAPTTDVTNTKLLANFTNAAIIDSTGKNNVETGANAQLDTTVKKFGTASYESDGSTSSFLTLSNSDMFPTGFSPFTIEGFIYINSPHKNYNNIISLGFGIQMYVDSGGKLICWLGNSSGSYFVNGLQSTATISLSTWTYIALVRNSVYPYTSNTVTWFVNGTAGGQVTEGVSNTIAPIGTYNTYAAIGAYPTGSYIYDGFLDELRITNKARYTSNFTAPTEEFLNR